jgi:ABC-2 type transport system permease protein
VRVWPIARREYLERVRSKAFLIGTFVAPPLLAALTILPSVLVAKQRGRPLALAVVDASGALRGAVEEALRARVAEGEPRFSVGPSPAGPVEEARRRARQQVLDGVLDGYLYLPADALERSRAEFYGKSVTNLQDLGLMQRAVEEALVASRLGAHGLDAGQVAAALRSLEMKAIQLTERGEREDRGASFFLGTLMLMALYTAVAMWGAAVMNGVIEEKTSRVVEVMVSSVPTTQLFAGKLLGIGAAGLTQFLVWALAMGAVSAYGIVLGGTRVPEVPVAALALLLVYFLLGFFLYGALYAAVGAAVNSQQEAQSVVFPVMMPLIVGVMLFPMVLMRPDSLAATVVSLVPFWTPLVMALRVTTLMPPAWQILLSLLLTGATIVLLNWGAARIFRVGILMYGKRPTLPEMLRWVRRA